MKATELLQSQHREIEKLFDQIRKGMGQADQKAIRDELSALLVAHTVMEEDCFYPALRDAAPELVDESLEEHGLADYELGRLLSAPAKGDEAAAQARLTVLAEVVLRHIRKEESDVFRRADSMLGNERLMEIGERMQVRFNEVRATGFRKFLERALAANMPKLGGRVTAKKTTRRTAPKKKAASATQQPAAKRPTTRRAPARAATNKRGGAAAAARKGKSAKTTRTPRRTTRSRPAD